MRALFLLSSLALFAGCGFAPVERGEPSGPGVAWAKLPMRVRSTDLVDLHVLFPADGAGAPVGAGHPAFVFVHGGLVEAPHYFWLAQRLAREGYVVALPEHEAELAIFATGNGEAARALLVEPPEHAPLLSGLVDPARIGVGGHSLGGVVATKLALNGGFARLVLHASLPDPADASRLPDLGIPSLSLAGREDCSAELSDVRGGWDSLPSPTTLAVLDGVTHYQFTDEASTDVERGCPPSVETAVAHDGIFSATLSFLRGENVGADQVTQR